MRFNSILDQRQARVGAEFFGDFFGRQRLFLAASRVRLIFLQQSSVIENNFHVAGEMARIVDRRVENIADFDSQV